MIIINQEAASSPQAADEKNLTKLAYEKLKEGLMSGTYPQGSLISISALSKQLNISRTPITNACLLLEHEGILTIVPKQGVIVKPMTINEIREVHELRAAVETYAAKCAFSSFKPADLGYLETCYQRQVELASANDTVSFMREDVNFHRYLIGKYENSKSISIINTLYERTHQLGLQNVRRPGRLVRCLQEHRLMIDSLINGDCDAYVHMTEQHILNGLQSLTSVYHNVEDALIPAR